MNKSIISGFIGAIVLTGGIVAGITACRVSAPVTCSQELPPPVLVEGWGTSHEMQEQELREFLVFADSVFTDRLKLDSHIVCSIEGDGDTCHIVHDHKSVVAQKLDEGHSKSLRTMLASLNPVGDHNFYTMSCETNISTCFVAGYGWVASDAIPNRVRVVTGNKKQDKGE